MADREAAVQLVKQCLEEAGYHVSVTPGEGFKLSSIGISATGDGSPSEAQSDLVSCRTQHLDPVEAEWHAQQGELTAEQVGQMLDRLEDCVASGGVPEHRGKVQGPFVNYRNAPRQLGIAKADIWKYTECAYQEEVDTGRNAPYPWDGYEKLDWLNEIPPRPN